MSCFHNLGAKVQKKSHIRKFIGDFFVRVEKFSYLCSRNYNLSSMKRVFYLCAFLAVVLCAGCANSSTSQEQPAPQSDSIMPSVIETSDTMQAEAPQSMQEEVLPEPLSTDLRLFELKGNVKSVKVSAVQSVTASGKRTAESTSSKPDIYYFDKHGRLSGCKIWHVESGYSSISDFVVKRDKAGNIVYLELPPSWNIGNDVVTYTWDEDGYPATSISSPSEGCGGYSVYTYDKQNDEITRTVTLYDAANPILDVKTVEKEGDKTTYKVLRRDDRGNWTKCVSAEKWETMRYTLRERKISYYE